MTQKQIEEFKKWLEKRPKIIKTLAKKFPPWFEYRIKKTNQKCQIYSYSENGTLSVLVNNTVLDCYKVFGLKPIDIVKI